VILAGCPGVPKLDAGTQTVNAIHLWEGPRQLVLANRRAGEEFLAAQIVVDQRIRVWRGRQVGNVERIRNVLIQVVVHRLMARVARGPVLPGQIVQALRRSRSWRRKRKDPAEALKAGQIMRVKVLSADPKAKRIALSIKALDAPREPQPKTERKPEPRKPTLEEQLAKMNQQFHRR
jgi:hypothetical protein